MITQNYKLPRLPEHTEAKPGHFVFDSYTDDIIGFVDFVSDTHFAIMLFKPMDLDYPKMESIQERCDPVARLRQIFNEDPLVVNLWIAIL